MRTQEEILLAHFQNHTTITPMEAHTVYKIRSLSRRVTSLKQMGHRISRVYKKDATGQRYASYVYLGTQPEAR